MRNSNPDNNYLSIDEYDRGIEALTQFTRIILTEYDKCSSETRDKIIRNFIARSISAVNGMVHLWRTEDYHDCWILYRSMLDRLFYLEFLGRENKFDDFDNWCFIKRYRYKKRCLKDERLVDKLDSSHFMISDKDRKRYKTKKRMWVDKS